MNTLACAKKALILQCLTEGMSLRATARLVGVERNTVAKLLLDAGRASAAYHDEVLCDLRPHRVEADELWDFVYAKEAHLDRISDDAPGWAGSTWTWTAIDPDTKLAIAWYVGERTAEHGKAALRLLRKRIAENHLFQLSTDGFTAYPSAVYRMFYGHPIRYGQVVKEYGPPNQTYTGSHKEAVLGTPDPALISTSIVERLNLSLRMSIRRYTRHTNAFSKRLLQHAAATDLFFFVYNFIRVHGTTGQTPAQTARILEGVWAYEAFAALIERGFAAAGEAQAQAPPPLAGPARHGTGVKQNQPRPTRSHEHIALRGSHRRWRSLLALI